MLALLLSAASYDSAAAEIRAVEARQGGALFERLLESARAALAEGRYDDAITMAQRAAQAVVRVDRGRAMTTAATPITEPMFEALSRLMAAEAQGRSASVVAAREIYTAAETELANGNFTRADNLAERVIMTLSNVTPPARDEAFHKAPRININTATPYELWNIPDWSQERLRNFLWFRRDIGPIRSLDEFRYIPGFSADYIPYAELYFMVAP